ncbi:MAG: hypothetical protein QOD42_726 [Sphingomonadales bacterium]|jgi:hypothetical protein|nr:hypothetical protein [Sphingomonadales bacterium]
MSGDFTRDTFRPAKAYSAVRMQQGRLFTDADWNEQGDIGRDALRRTATSVIGASGFPEDNPGFEIVPGSGGLVILAGEAYLDGIRVVLPPAPTIALKRSSGANAATKWQVEKGVRVALGDHLVLAGQAIGQGARVSALHPDLDGKQIFQCAAPLSAANNIEVRRHPSPESQPFLAGVPIPAVNGEYLAYLDVWERPIGVIEDPLLREVALGGPDTAMRDQVIWQVRFAKLTDLVAAGALSLPASCESFGPGWAPIGAPPRGAMAARAEAAAAAENPCVLPSTGGYRSLDNHLYRVEIHNGGTAASGKVAVKWSLDNGICRASYGEIDGVALLVDSIGRDRESALKPDEWVEIIDEARTLDGRPGFFARISDVNGNRVSVGELRDPDTLAKLPPNGPPNMAVLPLRGQIRRWEGGPPQVIAADTWIPLGEKGVEILFAAGRYAARDYWTIPARSISASIEWPVDPVAGAPALVPAAGVAHHYCALALATLTPGGWTLTDCRSLFAPQTRLRGFHYLGGDGQEAMPNPLAPAVRIPLDADLRAGYVRGRKPVAGANVRFTVTVGDGRLPNATKIQIVPTDAEGVAKLKWSLDAATQSQQVLAELLDSAGQRMHLPILYTANLSRAAKTSFDPANTPVLAGENTVQGAIEKLAGIQQIGCSTRVIVEGSDWVSVLKSLKPAEDATICFQRGTYKTQETVRLENLGHVTLSGAGGGTRIVGERRECALEFVGCASVTVHDLDIATPDGTGVIQNFDRRKGSLTIEGCPSVDVHDVNLSCGAGVAAERTCLTVRASAQQQVRSARILRNRLTVGYGQDGILLLDCLSGVVADNELGVSPRPASLPAPKLFETREWKTRLIGILVVKPVSEGFAAGGDIKEIRGGEYTASFESIVPQAEWNKLMADNPPLVADLKNAASFGGYVERIIDKALTPEQMPASHKKRIGRLAGKTGDNAVNALDKDVKRGLLIGSEPEVKRFEEKLHRGKGIILADKGSRILFDSPITQADWNKALKAMPAKDITRGSDLIGHVEKLAGRIIADEAFRNQLGSAKLWYDAFIQALPTFGRQAITCGGKTLGEIAVLRNRADGFMQGVHIGTSERRGGGEAPRDVARNVTVDGNILFLRLPAKDAYVPCGLFVGNANTVRIQRNTLAWATPKTAGDTKFAQGIRIWGYLGRFLLVGENRISIASLGIRIRPVEEVTQADMPKHMWLVADNLVDDVAASLVLKAPPFVEKRYNRPA